MVEKYPNIQPLRISLSAYKLKIYKNPVFSAGKIILYFDKILP